MRGRRVEIRQVMGVFALLCLVALAVVFGAKGFGAPAQGFAYGLVLFGANLQLLAAFAHRLFDGAGEGGKRSATLLGTLFLGRMLFFAVGAFIGLAILKVPVLWFVAGVGTGLVCVAAASLMRSKAA